MVNRRTVLKGAIGATVAGLIPAGLAWNEDSKVLYKVVRHPERRVFYVGNQYYTITLIKKQIKQLTQMFIFEPNDQITRQAVTSVLGAEMDRWKEKKVVYEYLIVCNDYNNTPAMIDTNTMVIDVAFNLATHPVHVNMRALVGPNGTDIQPLWG